MTAAMTTTNEVASGGWTNVEVYPYDLTFNQYDVPQYRRCHWCGADAIVIVARTSVLSGNRYEDAACERHAVGWGYQPAQSQSQQEDADDARWRAENRQMLEQAQALLAAPATGEMPYFGTPRFAASALLGRFAEVEAVRLRVREAVLRARERSRP